jgi:hypothetical protein
MSFSDWLASENVEREIDILFISPTQFHTKPQVGTPTRMTWTAFADYLSRPSFGEEKGCAGGFSPASYVENIRRKSNLRAIWALVVDIDGGGDVDRVADEVAQYDTITLETFSSTNDEPRCRLLLRLVDAVDAQTYETAHALVRSKLRRELGCAVDDGAKDASRLSYLPVRRPGAGYRFRQTSGRALDAKRLVALNPPKPRPAPVPIEPKHADAYMRAALRRAADAIGSAPEGARHETLCREAYGLTRLGLSYAQIRDALLPSAVAAMGDRRRREAERTIADAVRARKGVA